MQHGERKILRQKGSDQAENTSITQSNRTDYLRNLQQMRERRMEHMQQQSNRLIEQTRGFKYLHPYDQFLQNQAVSKHLSDLQMIITDAKRYLPNGHDMIESATAMAKRILEAYPSVNSFVHQGYTADLANIADGRPIEISSQDPPSTQDLSMQSSEMERIKPDLKRVKQAFNTLDKYALSSALNYAETIYSTQKDYIDNYHDINANDRIILESRKKLKDSIDMIYDYMYNNVEIGEEKLKNAIKDIANHYESANTKYKQIKNIYNKIREEVVLQDFIKN